ncbi:hypothetical protein HanXRQr2_Chr11g0487281 [Helianthus annuus]|uniref:Uncharacterized protein n=1 Tax=Helianthus annuus TaxID=4232 RepID=A0A9K3HP15_HELAN|nr:hypothetical protein HanXRQr2_Chr11g0487281 [Helianthus annuus]KAJ0874871.1 hypothetical protein HanPSC8_Chr11g0469461 [Helianthus annuus]
MIACWCIWKARNKPIFLGIEITGPKVMEDVKSLGFLWIKNGAPFKALRC